NMVQLYHYRRLISRSNRENKIQFVFVSEWMKRITQFDCAVRVKNYHIVPNPIDDKLFHPVAKDVALRKKILLIRPFSSKKYATDIATDMMVELKNYDFFNELSFTVFGKGSTSSRMYGLFKDCPNVSIKEGFLTQKQIKQLHDEHGIFIALTRQDAQGVSMCEAMSSSLVIITSNNTAIPEFVSDRVSGFLTNNVPAEAAKLIRELYEHPEVFLSISQRASVDIKEKAGLEKVIRKEMELINSLSSSKEKNLNRRIEQTNN
ncbi:MAG: glycosyltransferase family 4 protein, partial [Flavisolibacter sp.]